MIILIDIDFSKSIISEVEQLRQEIARLKEREKNITTKLL